MTSMVKIIDCTLNGVPPLIEKNTQKKFMAEPHSLQREV